MNIILANFQNGWPQSVAIATINDNCNDYCDEISEKLQSEGIRTKKDKRNEKLNYKIREISNEKIPFLLVIGDKEVNEKHSLLESLVIIQLLI